MYFVGVLLKVNNGWPFVAWTANIHHIVQLSHHYLLFSISFLSYTLHVCVRIIYCVLCVLASKAAKNNMAGFGVVAIR